MQRNVYFLLLPGVLSLDLTGLPKRYGWRGHLTFVISAHYPR